MNTGYGWGGSSSPGHPPKQNVQVTEQQIRQYEAKFDIDASQVTGYGDYDPANGRVSDLSDHLAHNAAENPKDYSTDSLGDGKEVSDGATTAGSTTVTSATGWFTEEDVGKLFHITYADQTTFVSTIASYVSSTEVTLAEAPPTTASTLRFIWGTDCTAALEAALYNTGRLVVGGRALLPAGLYLTTRELVMDKVGKTMDTYGSGRTYSGPTIMYVGPADDTKAVIKVNPGCHGPLLRNLILDGGYRAGYCYRVDATGASDDVNNQSATFDPVGDMVTVQGYRKAGVLLGKYSVYDPSTAVPSDAQMQQAYLPALRLFGGLQGAVGLMVNAQNCEKVYLPGLYSDPVEGREHEHHVVNIRGGLHISSFVSTRASDYAILSYEGVHIEDWNSEDRWAMKTTFNDPGSPTVIENFLQRNHPDINGNYPAATDDTFWFRGGEQPISLGSFKILGSIRLGQSTPLLVSGMNIDFVNAGNGAGWKFDADGTASADQRGFFHEARTGETLIRGSDPKVKIINQNGTVLGTMSSAGLDIPNGKINASSGYRHLSRFYENDVAAGRANAKIQCPETEGSLMFVDEVEMHAAGEIRIFTATTNSAPTAGTQTFVIVLNGITVKASNALSPTTGARSTVTYDEGVVTFAAGDRVSIWLETTADLAPAGVGVHSRATVEFNFT